MTTSFRDAERTFADFYWDDTEQRPRLPRSGLQAGLSRGTETDHLNGDITEWIFTAGGWRVLSQPDKGRREFAQLVARVGQLEGELSSLQGQFTAHVNQGAPP